MCLFPGSYLAQGFPPLFHRVFVQGRGFLARTLHKPFVEGVQGECKVMGTLHYCPAKHGVKCLCKVEVAPKQTNCFFVLMVNFSD